MTGNLKIAFSLKTPSERRRTFQLFLFFDFVSLDKVLLSNDKEINKRRLKVNNETNLWSSLSSQSTENKKRIKLSEENKKANEKENGSEFKCR